MQIKVLLLAMFTLILNGCCYGAAASHDEENANFLLIKKLTQGLTEKHANSLKETLKDFPQMHLGSLEGVASILTSTMDETTKWRSIESLATVSAESLTDGFIDAVNRLSVGMDGYRAARTMYLRPPTSGEHIYLSISCLNKVSAEYWGAFVDAVDRLSGEMNASGKAGVIEELATVPAEKLTPAFVDAVHRLSSASVFNDKANVIKTLVTVHTENLSAFVDAVDRLSVGMNAFDKAGVFRALATVPAERLEEIKAAVNSLSQGMNESDKSMVIAAIARVPAEKLTPAFVDAVDCLSVGMDAIGKVVVFGALETVPAEKLTPAFVDAVNSLFQGMNVMHPKN